MSETVPTTSPAPVLNIPNQVTIARIVVSLLLFVVLALGWYRVGFVLLVLGAGTDWIDGYWARKYGQITQLGRVLDPFADKLLICGTFIFLAAVPLLNDGTQPSGVAAWMAVVIVGRELLVTTLRAFVEGGGGDFSAKWVGKWKMVLQCVAAGWSLVHLCYVEQSAHTWRKVPPEWMSRGLTVVVWATVLLTLYSAIAYVRAAIPVLHSSESS